MQKCPECSTPFTKIGRKKYCSETCSTRAYNRLPKAKQARLRYAINNPESIRLYQLKHYYVRRIHDPKQKEYNRNYLKNYKWRPKNMLRFRQQRRIRERERYRTSVERRRSLHECNRRTTIRNKVKAVELYGGKCAYCGDPRYEVLCFDHVNGGGGKHRKLLKRKNIAISAFLLKTKYRPDLYQVLCHNCNAAKHWYGIKPGGNDYKPFQWWKEYSSMKNRSEVVMKWRAAMLKKQPEFDKRRGLAISRIKKRLAQLKKVKQ